MFTYINAISNFQLPKLPYRLTETDENEKVIIK